MDKSITFENKLLGEYLKSQEELELEADIKSHNIETKQDFNLYKRPNAKLKSKKEKNGEVRFLQNEVNFRNRDELIATALLNDNLKYAIVYYIIGSYKEPKIITKVMSDYFNDLINQRKIDSKFKNLFAAVRNYFGHVKKTVFASKYITHIRDFRNGNYFLIDNKAYDLKPDEAIKLINQFAPNDQQTKTYNSPPAKLGPKKELEPKKDVINCDNQKADLLQQLGIDLTKLTSNGITINFLGPININIK